MRISKPGAAALAILAVLVTAGTGFAAFTTSAYIQGSAQAGTVGPLVWGAGPSSTGLYANDNCSASVGQTTSPSDTLFLTAGNLAPGDICSYGDQLANDGTLPAVVTEQITSASGGLCSELAFGDKAFHPAAVTVGSGGQTGSVGYTIGADSYVQWAGFVHLLPNAGSAALGQTCSFVVTLTGTAGT